ncbi:MAG: fibronectin type III domain-containing protein, partial [Desulfosarcinaceae bacterium]|nr:fibronectin type III domain-containing protein [Desulfosarcinaceae bacterium]
MRLTKRSATLTTFHMSLPILTRILGTLFLLIVLLLTTAHAQAVSITLEWDANPQPELRGYKIFCRLASEDSYDYDKPVWAGTDGRCEISGLASGTDYCFVVRAFDAEGNESGDSNEVFYPGSQITPQEPPAEVADTGAPPNIPEPAPMPAEEGNTPLEPVLENSAQSENAGKEVHAETHWQVFIDDGQSDHLCVYDATSASALEQLHLPPLVLDEATTYFWRSRYVTESGNSGEWASPQYFTTTLGEGDLDGDGILDDQAVTSESDMNDDGISDEIQLKLRGVRTVVGEGRIAVDALDEDGVLAIERIQSLDPADPELGGGSGYDLPLGLAAFKLDLAEGASQVTVHLHLSHAPGEEMGLLTFDDANGWQNADELAQLAEDGKTVQLHLTDGGDADVDGVENGLIIFTGGYGRPINYRTPDGAGGGGGGG